MYSVDVIIPSYKPDQKLRKLLELLLRQSYPIQNIIIINTEKSLLDPALIPEDARISVTHIRKDQFDHGASRNLGVSKSDAALFLMMTEDAVPKDTTLVERLVRVFETDPYKDAAPVLVNADHAAAAMLQKTGEGRTENMGASLDTGAESGHADGDIGHGKVAHGPIGAVYGRQLATQESSYDEQYARQFNYPAQSFVKTQQDIARLGIKTYFESNVCCMYRRDIFDRLGGFIDHTIFNEDMIYCGKLLQAGYASAYEASAEVYHAHHYSGCQQFHRNFDLGVSQADHPEIFAGLRSEGEGVKLVLGNAKDLLRRGRFFTVPNLVWKSGCKYLGFRMGRNYQKLSHRMVLRCTMNPRYWAHAGSCIEENDDHTSDRKNR